MCLRTQTRDFNRYQINPRKVTADFVNAISVTLSGRLVIELESLVGRCLFEDRQQASRTSEGTTRNQADWGAVNVKLPSRSRQYVEEFAYLAEQR